MEPTEAQYHIDRIVYLESDLLKMLERAERAEIALKRSVSAMVDASKELGRASGFAYADDRHADVSRFENSIHLLGTTVNACRHVLDNVPTYQQEGVRA